ncbi:MAG: ABC transporter permease [Pirellulaceae bacterium]
MWLTTLHLGIRNLLLHKLRSFLTMLGTILGVASVIAMLAIGEGSKKHAVDRIRQLGANNVIVRSVKPDNQNAVEDDSSSGSRTANDSEVIEYGLRYKDLERLTEAMPTLRLAVPISLVRKNAQYGRRRISNARLLGTTPEYQQVKNVEIKRGRFLTHTDVERMANVAVLGSGAADRLFSYEDPIDKTVLLGSNAYQVVGVLKPHDSGNATPGAVGQQDYNNDIYIPIEAARSRFGELQMIVRAGGRDFERTQLSEITLSVVDEQYVSQTAAMARKLLSTSHPRGDDFEIQVPLELLRQAQEEKRIWNIVLGSIAGISLLVGGIGIMNIMLATVTERTREIGIRRALGARRQDIVLQFLVETVVLSASGGVLGIGLGLAIPVFVSMTSDIETEFSAFTVALSFGIAVLIGVIFGVYPARRAALLDPIEALRHN